MNNLPTIGLKKGFYIAFEGLDFSGKSHQIDLLRQAFQKIGFKVNVVREPGGCELGEELRNLIKNKNVEICPEAMLLLMNAARVQMLTNNVKPSLDRGEIVISDRSFYSSLLYQMWGNQLNPNITKAIISFSVKDITPDLVFVLDASEEERAKRKAKRNNTDRFESAPEDYLDRVKQGFEWLKGLEKKSNKIITIDTSGTIEMTHTEIYRCAAFRIGKLKDGQLEIDKAKQIITI